MNKAPGYPLPSGELGEDDIVCQLVYLPDRPEYWQAFYAALHYMTTWRAWERDDDKRGRDAASNWRDAFELTSGCWRMTCLQDLQDDVAAILAIMQIPPACCDAGDVTDGEQYTDRVTDGEGDVPQNVIDAGYAEDAADWAGFDDYKCMISHVIVDQLEARLLEIAPLVQTAGGVLGGVAALAGIIAVIFGTAGFAIVFGIVAGIGATSLLYQAITDFGLVDSLAIKIADNHTALACAVYDSDGDEGALVALNDKIDELFTVPEALILTNLNLSPTLKSLYAGRYDQQDIADILLNAEYQLSGFGCSCLFDTDYNIVEDHQDAEDRNLFTGGYQVDPNETENWVVGGTKGVNLNTLETYLGGFDFDTGDKLEIHRVKFDGMRRGDPRTTYKMITDEGTTILHHNDSWDLGVWYRDKEFIFDPPLIWTHPGGGASVFFQQAVASGHGTPFCDNFELDFNIILV